METMFARRNDNHETREKIKKLRVTQTGRLANHDDRLWGSAGFANNPIANRIETNDGAVPHDRSPEMGKQNEITRAKSTGPLSFARFPTKRFHFFSRKSREQQQQQQKAPTEKKPGFY